MLLHVFLICSLLYGGSCQNSTEPKIIGGTEVTDRSEFPYQAVIFFLYIIPFCGATIIDERHVLTAAHCIYFTDDGVQPSEVSIAVGNLNLFDRAVLKDVDQIFKHEKYDSDENDYDIAIFRIVDTFEPWTPNIQPIALNTDYVTGGNCTVSGWGTTFEGGPMTNLLMYVEVPIVDWNNCSDIYNTLEHQISNATICAGIEGKDSCQGDSGGPLVCSNLLTGIVSYGYGCAHELFPGVYTEVAKYIDWIQTQLERNGTTTSTATTTTSTTTASTTSTTAAPTTSTTTTPTTSTTTTPTTSTTAAPTTSTTTAPTTSTTTSSTPIVSTSSPGITSPPNVESPKPSSSISNSASLLLLLLVFIKIVYN